MPTGKYYRSPELLEKIRKAFELGRTREVQKKAIQTRKKIASNPKWREKVSKVTKEAMHRPEIRKKHLGGLSKAFGYDYDLPNQKIPTALSSSIGEDFVKRFWSRVNIKGPDECWEYQGYKQDGAYGSFWNGERDILSNRFVLMLALGRELIEEEMALHTCDNPPCCNPNHIYLGDHAKNMADKIARGRSRNRYTGKIKK